MCPPRLLLPQGVRVVLTDGNAHAVDSSELAFKLAAMYAFRWGWSWVGGWVGFQPTWAVVVAAAGPGSQATPRCGQGHAGQPGSPSCPQGAGQQGPWPVGHVAVAWWVEADLACTPAAVWCRQGYERASPTILEPIMNVEVRAAAMVSQGIIAACRGGRGVPRGPSHTRCRPIPMVAHMLRRQPVTPRCPAPLPAICPPRSVRPPSSRAPSSATSTGARESSWARSRCSRPCVCICLTWGFLRARAPQELLFPPGDCRVCPLPSAVPGSSLTRLPTALTLLPRCPTAPLPASPAGGR